MTLIKINDLSYINSKLKDEFIAALSDCINTSAFVSASSIQAFEKEFAKYIGTEYAIGVNSGTDALFLSLTALGVTSGDSVITVANTFTSTVSAICSTGAIPIFIDVDIETGLMDALQLAEYLSSNKTNQIKAIVPVHLWGQCAEMDAITQISQLYGIPIIEDACQAHGASIKNIKAGAWGTLGCFSFYPGKNLGALGDGGMITTNSLELYESLLSLRNCGQSGKYNYNRIGFVSRLDVLQASFLSYKLKNLDNENKLRQYNATKYFSALKHSEFITPILVRNIKESVFHQFVIKIESRQFLMDFLYEKNIEFGIHYPLPLHLAECYLHLGYGNGSLPNTEMLCEKILSIPIHPGLTGVETDRVIDVLLEYGDQHRC